MPCWARCTAQSERAPDDRHPLPTTDRESLSQHALPRTRRYACWRYRRLRARFCRRYARYRAQRQRNAHARHAGVDPIGETRVHSAADRRWSHRRASAELLCHMRRGRDSWGALQGDRRWSHRRASAELLCHMRRGRDSWGALRGDRRETFPRGDHLEKREREKWNGLGVVRGREEGRRRRGLGRWILLLVDAVFSAGRSGS